MSNSSDLQQIIFFKNDGTQFTKYKEMIIYIYTL